MPGLYESLVTQSVVLGAQYALVAIGIVVLFRHTGIANFAQGEILALGGLAALEVQRAFAMSIGVQVALVVGVSLLGGAIGAVMYAVCHAPLRRAQDDLLVVVGTLAVALLLGNAFRFQYGSETHSVAPLLTDAVRFRGFAGPEIAVIALPVMLVVGWLALQRYTRAGRRLTAVAQNPVGATLCGIDVRVWFVVAWAVSSLVGALAGMLVGGLIGVRATVPLGYLIKGFIAAVFGGLTSVGGALVGGIALGAVDVFGGYYLPTAVRDIVGFALLISVLLMRPQGMFGRLTESRL